MNNHAQTRQVFDRDLDAVQDDLLRLGSLVDTAIDRAMQALADRDTRLARQVVADDAQVNDLRFQIEEACVTLIATQQPAARDLRTIISAMNIVGDLERMGDHAAGIARTVLRMGDEPLTPALALARSAGASVDLPRMASECRDMVRKALDAYVARDAGMAREVAAQDDTLDDLYKQIFRELISYIVEDSETTARALYLLFSAHNLERIGDRAINIAERVIFMTSGEMKELNAGPDAPLAD